MLHPCQYLVLSDILILAILRRMKALYLIVALIFILLINNVEDVFKTLVCLLFQVSVQVFRSFLLDFLKFHY